MENIKKEITALWKEVEDLTKDINPTEITAQIENNNLDTWCKQIVDSIWTRLIDVSEKYNKISPEHDVKRILCDAAAELLRMAAEAPEIVRCMNCKYLNKAEHDDWCEAWTKVIEENGFCYKGRRKG